MHTAVLRLVRGIAAIGLFGLVNLHAPNAQAQTASRIPHVIDDARQTTLPASRHPLTVGAPALGHLDGATPLPGMTLHFSMSARQQADLTSLLANQQNAASSSYHRWLTPEQFGARFGMSDADLASATAWLERQGFTVQGSNRSRNAITFSGTAAQAEHAFSTRLDRYSLGDSTYFAPSQELSLPAALAPVVAGIGNLSSFRPRPHHHVPAAPRFTSSVSGNHYLAPDDFTTIYDIKSLYNAGANGSGITIAVIGQSAIATSDISAFRTNAGLSASTPTLTLVPNSGTSTATADDNQDESSLDVEWSGAVAPNATINFVYVGNANGYGAFDALDYAVQNNLAPIVSVSYGNCEQVYGPSGVAPLQTIFAQANAQGQTIIAASGDSAAADCDYSTAKNTVTSATNGLQVDFPASSPYVTGIGGTEFSGDVANPSTYWNSSNNASNGSALLYIPEEGWNDTSSTSSKELDGSGGGASQIFGKPSWQTGTGVPADGARDVPDIALNASNLHDGYLYCSQGSCSNGFRNSAGNLTVAGGTSFGAPTFSGILALIEQQLGSKGEGNINPTLYSLATKSTTSLHDITTGNNIVPCTAGTPNCGSSGALGYSAGTGYDQVTGLGTPDAALLATAFAGTVSGSGGSLAATTTTLTASNTAPIVNQAATYTATVTPNTGSGTPSGTIQFAVDGTNSGSAVALASGAASFSPTFTTVGAHTVTATYSGDSAYAASSSSLAVTVTVTTGSFTLSATNVTVKQGASGISTITVTPTNGYVGTVAFTASGPSTLTNSCFSVANAAVTGTAPVTATLTLYTASSSCATAAGRHAFAANTQPTIPSHNGMTVIYAGLLPLLSLFGIIRRRRGLQLTAMLLCGVGVVALLSGCGGSSSSSSTNAPKGTYTITITGTDNTNQLSNTATLTLIVN